MLAGRTTPGHTTDARGCRPPGPLAHHRAAAGGGQVGREVVRRPPAVDEGPGPTDLFEPAGGGGRAPAHRGEAGDAVGQGGHVARRQQRPRAPGAGAERSVGSEATSTRTRSPSHPSTSGPRSPGAQASPLTTSTGRPPSHGRSQATAPAVPRARAPPPRRTPARRRGPPAANVGVGADRHPVRPGPHDRLHGPGRGRRGDGPPPGRGPWVGPRSGGPTACPAPAASTTAARLSPMAMRQWTNPSQPQTLQIAVFLLYANAVFRGPLRRSRQHLRPHDHRRWRGRGASPRRSAGGTAWPSPWPSCPSSHHRRQGAHHGRIGLLFDIALVALLLPQSREYQRIWFS